MNMQNSFETLSKTEIVLFEDNCPIHGTEKVEKTIKKLNIALLPVQYSPALNGVVEAYFCIIKMHLIAYSTVVGENEIKDGIINQ